MLSYHTLRNNVEKLKDMENKQKSIRRSRGKQCRKIERVLMLKTLVRGRLFLKQCRKIEREIRISLNSTGYEIVDMEKQCRKIESGL